MKPCVVLITPSKLSPYTKSSLREVYYDSIFFTDEVLDFLISTFFSCHDNQYGLITELSFSHTTTTTLADKTEQAAANKLQYYSQHHQQQKVFRERNYSLESLPMIKNIVKLSNLAQLDVSGTRVCGGEICASQTVYRNGENASFDRPFVIDYDLVKEIRMSYCDCGDEKTVCTLCYKRFILSSARKAKDLLVESWGLKFEKDFFIFFSGGRGWHLWIFSPFMRCMAPDRRMIFLESIRSSIFPNATRNTFDSPVTKDLSHLIRMPLSLHTETCIPVLPLFSSIVKTSCVEDLLRWRDSISEIETLKDEIKEWVKSIK